MVFGSGITRWTFLLLLFGSKVEGPGSCFIHTDSDALKKREHLGTSPHWSWLGKYKLSWSTALCYPEAVRQTLKPNDIKLQDIKLNNVF